MSKKAWYSFSLSEAWQGSSLGPSHLSLPEIVSPVHRTKAGCSLAAAAKIVFGVSGWVGPDTPGRLSPATRKVNLSGLDAGFRLPGPGKGERLRNWHLKPEARVQAR